MVGTFGSSDDAWEARPIARRGQLRGCAARARSQPAPWRRTACTGTRSASDITNREHLIFAHAARRLHLGYIACRLANQCARNRRVDRNLASIDVGFIVTDYLIAYLVAGFEILQLHRRTEYDATFRLDLRGIDDMRVGKLGLVARYASFKEPMPLPGRLVLGVLRQVAVRARFSNRGDHRGPVNRLQPMQLDSELLGTSLGQWNLH